MPSQQIPYIDNQPIYLNVDILGSSMLHSCLPHLRYAIGIVAQLFPLACGAQGENCWVDIELIKLKSLPPQVYFHGIFQHGL